MFSMGARIALAIGARLDAVRDVALTALSVHAGSMRYRSRLSWRIRT